MCEMIEIKTYSNQDYEKVPKHPGIISIVTKETDLACMVANELAKTIEEVIEILTEFQKIDLEKTIFMEIKSSDKVIYVLCGIGENSWKS